MKRAHATLILLACVLAGCGGSKHTAPPADMKAGISAAVQLCDPGDGSSIAQATSCYERRLLLLLTKGPAAASELPQIDAAVKREGGFLYEDCHILMHWVGRNFATDNGVTLGTLQQYLPRTNNPGCSAGFAHGMISALGKTISRLDPRQVAATCDGSSTRYQAYSCIHGLGHAYMRAYIEMLPLALRQCSRLPANDVVDCAQGAFHDYWFAREGADNLLASSKLLSPRQLCGQQRARFVRACWYRAYLESPPDQAINTPADIVAVCAGLRGLQEQGCITGASVTFNSGRPDMQVTGCAELDPSLRVSCVRGVATQAVPSSDLTAQLRLLQGCTGFGAQREGCVEWLAKALNVDTNGRFLKRGCAAVNRADRKACRVGAAAYRGPLETFS